MEIDEEATYYMDVDPVVLMLRGEGAYWEPPTIMGATTELKNWAWEGGAHPMEDSIRKIKTTKPITPVKNIVYVPIESISASISVPVEFVCDSFLVEFD